eukprot:snap_masked-scaffold_41-processed-gene-2.80-mRNA-1 protein AED:1.00 eAED:1.00 QI:0/0/0/0/1/1/2/0/130
MDSHRKIGCFYGPSKQTIPGPNTKETALNNFFVANLRHSTLSEISNMFTGFGEEFQVFKKKIEYYSFEMNGEILKETLNLAEIERKYFDYYKYLNDLLCKQDLDKYLVEKFMEIFKNCHNPEGNTNLEEL